MLCLRSISVCLSPKAESSQGLISSSLRPERRNIATTCFSGVDLGGAHISERPRGSTFVAVLQCRLFPVLLSANTFSGLAKIPGMWLGVVKAKNEVGQPSRVCPDHGNPQRREDLALGPGAPDLPLLSALLISWNLC